MLVLESIVKLRRPTILGETMILNLECTNIVKESITESWILFFIPATSFIVSYSVYWDEGLKMIGIIMQIKDWILLDLYLVAYLEWSAVCCNVLVAEEKFLLINADIYAAI